jgi:hypothetical protein
VGRGVGQLPVGNRRIPDRHGVAVLGGHVRTVRQRGRRGNGPGIGFTTPS